jgi:hypothetical protein
VHARPRRGSGGGGGGGGGGSGGGNGSSTDSNRDVVTDIFTPTEELPFAGHPTIGTICALHSRSATSLANQGPVIISGGLRTKAGRIVYTYTHGVSSKEDNGEEDNDNDVNVGSDESGSGSRGTATATIPHDVCKHAQPYSRQAFFARQQPELAGLEHTFRDDEDDEDEEGHGYEEQQEQKRNEALGSTAGGVRGEKAGEARQQEELRVASICNGMNYLLVRLPSLEWLAKVAVTPERVMPRLDVGWDEGFTGCYFWVDIIEEGNGDGADCGSGSGVGAGVDGGAGGQGPAATESSAAETVDTTKAPITDDPAESLQPLQLRLRTRMIEGPLEDAATGSAACTLAAFLALRAARSVRAEIIQSVEMGKESHLTVEVDLKRAPNHEGDNHSICGGGRD